MVQTQGSHGLDHEYGTLGQMVSIGRAAPAAEARALASCGHSPHRDQVPEMLDTTSRFLDESDTLAVTAASNGLS